MADTSKRHTLYWSANSPYVRKVLVAIQELGVGAAFQCVSAGDFILTGVGPSPITTSLDLDKFNPTAKIPTLVCNDGEHYFGSQAIEQYLEYTYGGDSKLFPQGKDRLRQIMLESLADGLLDAALQLRYEVTIRPNELRWTAWSEGQKSKITRTLAAISPSAGKWPLPDPSQSNFPMGGIAIAAALWYLDARFPEIAWREDKQLAQWYAAVQKRKSWKDALEMKP